MAVSKHQAHEWVSGNIYIRPLRFAEHGGVVQGHEHCFDHTTYIVAGRVRIEELGNDGSVVRSVDAEAGQWALIRAGVRHRLTALTPNAVGHCIYSHRNPQGDITQEWDGWTPAYH